MEFYFYLFWGGTRLDLFLVLLYSFYCYVFLKGPIWESDLLSQDYTTLLPLLAAGHFFFPWCALDCFSTCVTATPSHVAFSMAARGANSVKKLTTGQGSLLKRESNDAWQGFHWSTNSSYTILLMEEILHHLGCIEPCTVNSGINYQPQLVNAGFLNHQQ